MTCLHTASQKAGLDLENWGAGGVFRLHQMLLLSNLQRGDDGGNELF